MKPEEHSAIKCAVWLALAAIVMLVAASWAAQGAQGPAMIDQARLTGMTLTPLYDTAGNLLSFHASATFSAQELGPSGKPGPVLRSVQFDFIRAASQRIFFEGQEIEYGDVPDDLIKVAAFEFSRAYPARVESEAEVVQVRKALRGKEKK